MSEVFVLITLSLTSLLIVAVFLIFRVQSLGRSVLQLRDQLSQVDMCLSDLRETSQQLATGQRDLLSVVTRRDAYEAFESHHQTVIDAARDRLSLQGLRQKYGIPSSSALAESSLHTDENQVSSMVGGEK